MYIYIYIYTYIYIYAQARPGEDVSPLVRQVYLAPTEPLLRKKEPPCTETTFVLL